MLLLSLIAIGGITFANIRSVIDTNRASQLDRVQKLADLLRSTQFPMTNSILDDMKQLSGAEFVLVDQANEVLAKTKGAPRELPQVDDLGRGSITDQTGTKIVASGEAYYHSTVKTIQAQNRRSPFGCVHIFVPRQSDLEVWWQASSSPLLIAALILPLALLISIALANQVTSPLARFQQQVQEISQGEVREIPVTTRNDEIRDLNLAINEMASQLQDHDDQLRQNERLRTRVQFGSGVAHHLRNSATGCKMAIELLAAEHDGLSGSDNFQVALRQLGLMDNYIKRFLRLAKTSNDGLSDSQESVDLAEVLERVVFLLHPSAKHLSVKLSVHSNLSRVNVNMAEVDAEQLMMNLISNAITAASEVTSSPDQSAIVNVVLNRQENKIVFQVSDNGPGPPAEIAETLFQPFVTGSREGTGLGLSLVREIAERVNGSIQWTRIDEETRFTFEMEDNATAVEPKV